MTNSPATTTAAAGRSRSTISPAPDLRSRRGVITRAACRSGAPVPLSRFVVALSVGLLCLLGPTAPEARAQTVPPLPPATTYIMPTYGGFGASDADFAAAVADLKARLGEGPLAPVGFTSFIFITMSDYDVDTSDPAAVRAALGDTIGQIDTAVAKGIANNIPIGLSFVTAIRARYDPLQTSAEREDRRNTQWYTDNALASGWISHSQYARKLRRQQEAYIRELGRIVANYMARYPNIVVAATGDGEVELTFDRWRDIAQPEPPSWADYSPFAVAEFRDWLRGAGLYAAGQPLSGEGYANRARYAGDLSPAADTNGDGHTLNSDFGLNFSTWDLRYFDWSLADSVDTDPNRIPFADYSAAGWDPMMPDNGADRFDAPRVMLQGHPWWNAWIRFRQEMIRRHNRDFAKWMTTSVDPATGATIPAERFFSDQIPADYLFYNPDAGGPNDFGVRLMTSASAWWTADIRPYGSLGITSYNVNEGFGSFKRTLPFVAPEIAATNQRWGIIEWNPSDPWTADPTVYREEMAVVEQYGPSVLMPFFWGNTGTWKVQDTGFEIALRELIARIGKPRLAADRTTLAATVVRNTSATPPQTVVLSQIGAGVVNWTAVADRSWIQMAPAAGTGGRAVLVSVNPADPTLPASGTTAARITISSPDAYNTVTIDVTVTVTNAAATTGPFGQVDTPAQNATGVQGAIGVTGWALDDVGIAGVAIYRNCLPFENQAACQIVEGTNVVFVGDAAILPGARPDVERDFAAYPQANRAGWGFLLLTTMLPDVTNQQAYGGQGPIALYVYATDVEGRRALLGRTYVESPPQPTTMMLANAGIAKPFGAIDTPGQGATVSGVLANFGWALTPDSDTAVADPVAGDAADIVIPPTGSTMFVFLDGVATAAVQFNHCRGDVGTPPAAGVYCNDDVAMVFGYPTPQTPPPPFVTRTGNPTRYRNLDAGRGAIGAFNIDTRTLTNGLHTIAWSVTDSAGRTEGIGSRFFQVLNTGTRDRGPETSAVTTATISPPAPDVGARLVPGAERAGEQPVSGVLRDASRTGPRSPVPGPADAAGLQARVGFDLRAPFVALTPDEEGIYHVRLGDLDRLELDLGPVVDGYLDNHSRSDFPMGPREITPGVIVRRALPIGANLDPATGVFTWAPPPGYLGTYRLVFSQDDTDQKTELRRQKTGGAESRWSRDLSSPGAARPSVLARDNPAVVVVDVTIAPRTPSEPGESAIRMHLDAPADGSAWNGTVQVVGWALDPQAAIGSGIGAVHVWAQRTDVAGAAPVFLGEAALGWARPDVAAAHGAPFGTAGFALTSTPPLPAGTYDVTAYAWNVRTQRWEDARTARVAVK